MEQYNFNEFIDRRGSGCLKYDALERLYGRSDLLPLWVADMDFATPPFIVKALQERLAHPVYGYAVEPDDFRPSIIRWQAKQHGWDIKPEWISYIPGIVKGIGMAINVFVAPDEKVIIQPPVYHPFRLTTLGNHREVVNNPLRELPDGSYAMDFDNLEEVADDKCRMLLLSNPHNPAGVVWDRATLERLARFCHQRDIIVVSDEIHCDMTLFGHKHLPFASVSDEAAACSITFGAPTKTFNIAGIVSSFAIVPNAALRRRFFSWLAANEQDAATFFATTATIAAFNQGDEWRKQMLAYVEDNIRFVEDYCAQHIPGIRPWRPQASFLVWLDCRALGLSHEELVHLFVQKAGLALNDGEIFGREGAGFMRMNVGAPRSTIRQALEQLHRAHQK